MKYRLTLAQKCGRFGGYCCTMLLCLFTLFPFFWILSCSFKNKLEIMTTNPTFIPENPTFENYINAVQQNDILRYLANSLIITIAVVLLTVLIGALASYAISFMETPSTRSFQRILVAVQMLPLVISLVPLFVIFSRLHLMNTRIGIVLAYTASTWGLPVAIILLQGYFTEIPKALIEAARLDGCSTMRIFSHVILPLSMPGLVSTGINIFLNSWQEFTLAVNLISDKAMYTLPVGLTNFIGMHGTDWGGLMATSVVIALPSIVLFVGVQKYFIDGMTGSVKE